MDEASRCHRVGFMRKGRLIAEGAPSQLRLGLNGRILELRGQSPIQLRPGLEKMEGVEDVRIFGDKLHLRVAAGRTHSVLSALALAYPAGADSGVQVRLVPPTLEDVFIALTENGI